MIRKIVHIALCIVLPACALLLAGSAMENNRKTPCTRFEVAVEDGHAFVKPGEIRDAVVQQFDSLQGQVIGRGMLPRIRQLVLTNPYIERAAVYRTIDGGLHIRVSQREPLIRIINGNNQSFYIDHSGQLLPANRSYTPRVVVATGHIGAGYSPNTQLGPTADTLSLSDGEQRLRGLYLLAKHLDQDPFWRAFIDQVYVTRKGEFELLPKNGAHTIELGSLDQLDEKLDKLMFFYRNGIGQVGWNYYSRINIKFNKQIVCSK